MSSAQPVARPAASAVEDDDFALRLISVTFLVRLLSLVAAVLGLAGQVLTPPVLAVVLLLGAVSYAGTALRGRVPGFVLRHPSIALLDVLLVLLVLAVAGVDSPLALTTYSTALLVGAVFPPAVAAVLGVVLVGGHTLAWQATGMTASTWGFAVVVGTPVLYACLVGIGGAVRALHEKQLAALRALAVAEAERTGAEERARLAREMHDSLAKTLHGVALSAASLPTWLSRDPERAASHSQRLADDAERAAAEARAILDRMRADQPDRPLAQVLADRCRAFTAEHGVACEVRGALVDVASDVRYELVAVVEEALRNAAAHADASHVVVGLRTDEEHLEVLVSDNGRGFVPRPDGDGPRGHYGLRGMRERAELVGGHLQVASAPGSGTVVVFRVPREAAA